MNSFDMAQPGCRAVTIRGRMIRRVNVEVGWWQHWNEWWQSCLEERKKTAWDPNSRIKEQCVWLMTCSIWAWGWGVALSVTDVRYGTACSSLCPRVDKSWSLTKTSEVILLVFMVILAPSNKSFATMKRIVSAQKCAVFKLEKAARTQSKSCC